jgi:hypothetical protein
VTRLLSPEEFSSVLDRVLRQQVEDRPAAEAVADDVRVGRRLLRRRRATQAVVSIAAAAAVIATLPAATSLLDGDPDESFTADRTWTAAQVREACLGGNQSERDTDLMSARGGPVVAAFESNALWTMAALESGDGGHWAECFISHDSGNEFTSGMTVYRAAGNQNGISFGTGTGCPKTPEGEVDRDCRHFSVRWVDRLPAQIATVRFETNDGVIRHVPTEHGFVVFNPLGDLPPDVSIDRYGGTGRWRPIHRVTYLDAADEPLASQYLDGAGKGPDGERVDGLPPLVSVQDSELAPR